MQCIFTFYLQIFTGVQRGFLVSPGRCPICKWFRSRTYQSCPHLCSQPLLLSVPIVLPNLQEEMEQNFVFNVSPHRKVQGCYIRRSCWPSYRSTTSNPTSHRGFEVGNHFAMGMRGVSHLVEKGNLCPNLPSGDFLLQTGALSWFSWSSNEGLPHIFYRLIFNRMSNLGASEIHRHF